MKYPLTGVEGGNYIPVGTHDVKITDITYDTRKTQKGDKRVMMVHFRNVANQVLSETFWMTEPARFRILNLAKACGLCQTPDDLENFDTEMVLGHMLRISVIQEAGTDGKMYSRVADFAPAGSQPQTDLNKQITDKMGGYKFPEKDVDLLQDAPDDFPGDETDPF